MITISRLPEPAVLAQNRTKWLDAYRKELVGKPKTRPNPRQYGHEDIRITLRSMSFHKCFYCERQLSEREDEVEHYIEVAERPDLAFDWNNLCLSCTDCNSKKRSNVQIPVIDCVHPCDPAEHPADHLAFADEYIRPKAGSRKGAKTIQKYCLDRDDLNYRRSKQLQHFERFLRQLQTLRLREGNRPISEREKEALAHFRQPDHAFSLMFSVYLAGLEL